MIEVEIPGYRTLKLAHLVMDYNGTLAVDGHLENGVGEVLRHLAAQIEMHVVTADTFGLAGEQLKDLPVNLAILPPGGQDVAKRDMVGRLGCAATVAVGNGRNDRLMVAAAEVGIAVLLREGAAAETMAAADIICPGILPALELLLHPLRLTATLRS